jgi:hypothetical protein
VAQVRVEQTEKQHGFGVSSPSGGYAAPKTTTRRFAIIFIAFSLTSCGGPTSVRTAP